MTESNPSWLGQKDLLGGRGYLRGAKGLWLGLAHTCANLEPSTRGRFFSAPSLSIFMPLSAHCKPAAWALGATRLKTFLLRTLDSYPLLNHSEQDLNCTHSLDVLPEQRLSLSARTDAHL